MDRWMGKVAVITGASSGIGETISICLVEHGLKVVGLARRVDNMMKTADALKNAKGVFYPIKCDLTKEEDILEAFKSAEQLGGVDILINNAGLAFPEYIIDGTTEHLKNMVDVNVLAAAICTREATKSMRKRGTPGHIININSVLGHNASQSNAPLCLYQTTKHALAAMSEVVRNEITLIKAPIKVTNLSPGLVKTNMPIFEAGGGELIFTVMPHLKCQEVADAVLYILGTPENVQVAELTITALHEGALNEVAPFNP